MEPLTDIEKNKINNFFGTKHKLLCDNFIKTVASIVMDKPDDALLEIAWLNDFWKGLMVTALDRIKDDDQPVPDNICGWKKPQ